MGNPQLVSVDSDSLLFPSSVQGASGRVVLNASFGPLGTPDDSGTFLNAIKATPAGGTLVIPPGTYTIGGTGLSNIAPDGTPKSMNIHAHGATLIKSGTSGRLFTFSGTWDATVPVSSVTSGTVTEASVAQNSVTVTHGGTMPWKRGDVVKLFSDDPIPGARDNSTLSGQFLTVYATATGATTFLGVLRDPLTTNVRMARLLPVSVNVAGGIYDVTDQYLLDGNPGEMFGFESLHSPSIRDAVIRRSPAQGISMVSNYGYAVDNVEILWAWNDGNTHYGYGINDNASYGGSVSNCRFAQVRHGFTDSNAGVNAGDSNPRNFGRSVGSHISNVTVDSSTSSAFDTHQGGEGHTFTNCTAYNAQVGFGLRGRKHQVVGCKAINCATGARVFTESGGVAATYGAYFGDFYVDGSTLNVMEFANNFGSGSSGTREARPSVVNGLQAVNVSGGIFSSTNATVRYSNVSVFYTGSVASSLNSIGNSFISGSNWYLDFFNSTGTGATLMDAGSTSDSRIELDGMRVVGFSALSTRIARAFQNTATSNIFAQRLLWDYSPGTAWYTMTTANTWVDYDSVANVGDTSAFLAITSASDSLARLGKTRELSLVLEITAAAAFTLPALPNPLRKGQVLKIVNNTSSAANVTINNGVAANTTMSAAKTLTPGQTMMLEASDFGSGKWRQVTTV